MKDNGKGYMGIHRNRLKEGWEVKRKGRGILTGRREGSKM